MDVVIAWVPPVIFTNNDPIDPGELHGYNVEYWTGSQSTAQTQFVPVIPGEVSTSLQLNDLPNSTIGFRVYVVGSNAEVSNPSPWNISSPPPPPQVPNPPQSTTITFL